MRLRPTFPYFHLAPVCNNLTDCSVTEAVLADSAVTEVKLSFSDVTTKNATDSEHGLLPKLSGDSTQFLNGDGEWRAPTATVADCSITSAKIADSGVTAADIADSAVVTTKITDCAVTYAKIQDVSAGARLLGRYDAATGTIQEIALAGGLTFDSDAGTIASDTTIAATIGDCTITDCQIADCAVTSVKLNNTAVTYAKIQDVTAQRLLGREDAVAGSPQEIALSAELRFDTDNDWLEIADCGVISGLIADSAITTTQLNDCSVTSAKIADSSVTANEIADSAIIAAKLSDCAVTSAKLGDTAVISSKISDCAIISSKLGDTAVTTGKINANAVTADKMSDSNILSRILEIHVTDTTLAVGDTAATFFIPAELNAFDLIKAEACVKVADTAGIPTIQIRNVTDAADMLTTKITIDSGEKTSYTAATASVIDTGNDSVATGDEIAIDIDSGTSAEDLYVILTFKKY